MPRRPLPKNVPMPRAETVPPPETEIKILPTSLPKELLRGVPLQVCLAGFGKHWAASDAASLRGTSSYSLSQVVTSLDAFLSHDWGTSRWAKMLAMMIIFNSRAAFITSMLASLVLAIWAYCDALPRRQTWTVWPPLVTFYMFLFFWQRIRLLFKPPRMVFLDKLCISQDNDELKAQGIAGLATFLLKSRKMTILWSPRYFLRLKRLQAKVVPPRC
ncbi:unnamed protein product [Effrenium voratum]|uniref:Uncharacterized protein n=1 Tax=Effrenium voratum TaxID=2562239 RepID=A0AA36HVG8_9DINO|nr:unnamed protein product [Effrenium voratum]CAJ1415271.1 unnamed protein product [Effrenium voratum]